MEHMMDHSAQMERSWEGRHVSHGVGAAGHPATSLSELHHPNHGSYEGHVVPGVMFIVWSTYWLWSVIDIHLRSRGAAGGSLPSHTAPSRGGPSSSSSTAAAGSSRSSRRRCCAGCSSGSGHVGTGRGEPFSSRAWYPWPYCPAPHLEPILKCTLPLVGVLIELYIGWGGWRPLYAPDGHWAMFHIGNWQHALMYAGFAVSGLVDLIGYYAPPGTLPPGTEKGFLAMSLLVETLLMGMHKKPNPLDSLVHVLLTGVMVCCVAVCAAEIAVPNSLLLALLRCMVVFFQGTWFWHVGAIMFKDQMAWDMEDMSSVHMLPVVFCLHIVLITLGTLTVYLFMRWAYTRAGIILPLSGSGSQAYQAVPVGVSSNTNGSSNPFPKQGALAFVHSDSGDTANGSDCFLIESHLELSDYNANSNGNSSSGGSSARDAHHHSKQGAHRL